MVITAVAENLVVGVGNQAPTGSSASPVTRKTQSPGEEMFEQDA